MDLRALEVFCKIVELRSFSRAAEAVFLTQPTVSGHIKALADHAVDPASLRVVLEVTGNEAVRQALKAGAGIAVISRRAIEDDIRSRAVTPLRIQGVRLMREFFLVTHKSRSRSPLGKAFLSFLQQAAKAAG
ncbi:MAG: LysR family transcriptional regulator [candidate division NC10 bacterium]|nr:LysR family transcriptional regulator [candidate division NC10 bacterium]